MQQWIGSAMVQVMAYLLLGTKLSSVQTSMKFKSKYKKCKHENAFKKDIWEMAAILSRERWINISQL